MNTIPSQQAHSAGFVGKENTGKQHYKYILIGLLILLGVIIFTEIRIYLGGFLAAFALYAILRGQMSYLVEKRKWNRGISAGLIMLEALLFILIPLTGIGFLVADTVSGITIDPQQIKSTIDSLIASIEERLKMDVFATDNLTSVTKFSSTIMQTLASSAYSMIINTVVAIFVLYFMLLGYDKIEKATVEMLPFREENKAILKDETRSIVQANVIGVPAVAFIQGVLAYFGYLFFGVSNPLVFAVLTAFATVIPIFGTGLVWVPLALVPIMGGDYVKGISIALYGLLIVGGMDTVSRFVLQKKLANIHPLITFFGVFIGIPMFGFWGVIFGPLLISLLVLFFNMYRRDYVPGSTAEPRATTRSDFKRGFNFKRKKKT